MQASNISGASDNKTRSITYLLWSFQSWVFCFCVFWDIGILGFGILGLGSLGLSFLVWKQVKMPNYYCGYLCFTVLEENEESILSTPKKECLRTAIYYS